jgi:HD-like signal output (HDOD) protein
MDKMFAFGPGGEGGFKPLFERGEAEQRASTVLAKSMKALPAMVLEASKSSGPEPEGLETAIEADPVLASLVLASGASEIFGRGGDAPQNLLSLLERVGVASFRNITFIATFFRDLLTDPLPWYGYAVRGLWRHTLATAIASRKVGEALGFHPLACDLIFFGAIFHDIGKPTIQALLADQGPGAVEASSHGQFNILETERRLVNMTHTELVPLILDIYGIEHSIFGVAQHHHAPQRAGKHAIQASIVQLGDQIANAAGVGLEIEYPFAEMPLDRAAAKMNVQVDICESIRDELGLLVAEVTTEFEQALGPGA